MTTEQQPPIPLTPVVPPVNKNSNLWAMMCHLSSLVGFVIPFCHVLAPLIIWALKKEESPFINQQGKESLNFQISMTLYFIVAYLLIFLLIGFVLIPLLILFDLIIVIIASIEANQGKSFRYPLTIRFVR